MSSYFDALQKSPFLTPDQKAFLAQTALIMECQNVIASGPLYTPPLGPGHDVDRTLHKSKWQRHFAYEAGDGNRFPGTPAAQKQVDKNRKILYDTPVDQLPALWKKRRE